MKYSLLGIFTLLLVVSLDISAHSGGTDKQGGHFNRKTEQYHCHKEPCFSIHSKSSEALQEANSSNREYSSLYNRKDWPHWTDDNKDCQNTRAEILISHSQIPVKFKRNKGCNVTHGQWYGVYTNQTYTKASDLDIDHIVPLSHAHRHGAAGWSRDQKRTFANDPENLLPVDDNTNQEKGDKGPDYWRPPYKPYWCEYSRKWDHIKLKYNLEMKSPEKSAVLEMKATCKY